MNAPTIIVAAVIIALVCLAVRSILKGRKAGGTCGSCGSCRGCGGCGAGRDSKDSPAGHIERRKRFAERQEAAFVFFCGKNRKTKARVH